MKVFSKDGTAIAYDKTGQGPALVLVDGAFCYRAYGVSPRLVPLLSSHFTVFSYDRRGRGESADTKPYAVEREIDDLKAIVDLTGEQPFVFGSSSGAALVMQAVGRGLPVKKIALFEPPYVVTSDRDTGPPKDAQATLVNLIERGDRAGAVKYFMKDVMGMPAPIVFLFKLFGRSYWLKNEGVAHTLPYDIAVLGNFAIPKSLASAIKVPAVVIGGDRSPVKLRKAITQVGHDIPNAGTCLLKGQNHNVSMKVLAPVLTRFFI